MTMISYQLYGSRNWDLSETLGMLSRAGYKYVEGYRDLFTSEKDLPKALENAGISMPTLHFGLEQLEADPDAAFALCRSVGADTIYAPYLEEAERPVNRGGWLAFAERLQDAAKLTAAAGLKFGWHNHDFELVDLGEGETPLDLLAEAAPDVSLELDLGWVVRAGLDPLTLIEAYGARITAAHIKDVAFDGENTEEDGWSDVGFGQINWRPIHAALQEAGVIRYVIEHDNPSDHERFATRSLKTVKDL